MAFTQNTFAPVGAQSAPSPTVYTYSTDDDFATVTTAGYFLSKEGQLEEGDLIFAFIASVMTELVVSSDTSTVTFEAKSQTVLNASSFSGQDPTGLDAPLQIEFGAAQGTTSDPLSMDANGTITCNLTSRYNIFLLLQYGRSGAGGVSWIFFRFTVNGVSSLRSVLVKLENANSDTPVEISLPVDLVKDDVLKFELIRDSQGVDSGGLVTETPILAGWPTSPSTLLIITR